MANEDRVVRALKSLERRMTKGFEAVGQRFDTLEGRFGALEGRFGALEGRFGTLDGRFGTLEQQVAANKPARSCASR